MQRGHACITCVVEFATPEEHKAHYRDDWHRYNLKRKIAGLKSVTRLNFEQRKGACGVSGNAR